MISLAYLRYIFFDPYRRIEHYRHSHEIASKQLKADPIFILGHWRSGTGILQYVLCQDEQFGYVSKFDMLFPELLLKPSRVVQPIVVKLTKYWNSIHDYRRMFGDWAWDSPGELDVALTIQGSMASPHWGHIFPASSSTFFNKYLFFEDITEEEQKVWKSSYRHIIKKLSIKNNDRRLVIKSSCNTARIKQLLELFPNAKFIYIHRNPYEVYYSNVKLWDLIARKLAFQKTDEMIVMDIIVKTYRKMIQSYMNQRELVPSNQLVELRLEEFANNPVDRLKHVYDTLELDGFAQAQQRFVGFTRSETDDGNNTYPYDAQVVERVNTAWKFSLDEWEYENPLVTILGSQDTER